jgi:hypothetical protein
VRITIDIPDELYRQVDMTATRERVSLRDLIAQGLRFALSETNVYGRGRVAFPLLHSAQPGTMSVEDVHAAEESAASREDSARAGTL